MKDAIRHFGIAVIATCLVTGICAVQAAPAKAKPAKAAPAGASTRSARPSGIAQNPYVGAIVVDAATGRVLVEDHADAPAYPASVLKLMDLLIILERIQQHQLSLSDPVPVSAKAAKLGGSQVWLEVNEVFSLDEMLYALMVKSANDVAVALAEKVAGTTDAFVELMNRRARELGMSKTVFHSVHGLPPGPGQEPDVTTARDLALLCRILLPYPDTLRYTSTREHLFRPNGGPKMVRMQTHNHLMASVSGCDGLKTGFFTRAGFSIAATATRNGQRVVAIVLGSTDRKVRDAKAAELLAKGFSLMPAASVSSGLPNPVKNSPPPAKQ
jgi:serine-type D-Ala-D-Ala carboxypeptidase (penicillin-binding protein 5/6)